MTAEEKQARYRTLLLDWNRKINLIGPEAVENLDAHIDEGVEAAEILKPAGLVLDFGSGGGLPAIPMAIHSPDATFHLVEADQRKWSFLKFAARECELKAVVHGDRLERLVRRMDPELRFTLVTSRAVGKPEQWLPLIRPFLAENGSVALFQSGDVTEEIRGFGIDRVVRLQRGDRNALVVLRPGGGLQA